MIRFIVSALGYLMMAGAFVTIVIDGTRSIASSAFVLTSLRSGLERASPTIVPALRATLSSVHAALWDPVAIQVLSGPLAAVLAALGVILVLLARPREDSIGYDTRA